jgi:fumarate reductase subunit D
MAKSNEPIVWSLFSAGGVVAAVFVPVLMALLVIAYPLGWVNLKYNTLHDLVVNPIVRIFLFVVISLPLFHWAHRFRFTLVDLGLKKLDMLIAVLCYGAAIVGTGVAAYYLWTLQTAAV